MEDRQGRPRLRLELVVAVTSGVIMCLLLLGIGIAMGNAEVHQRAADKYQWLNSRGNERIEELEAELASLKKTEKTENGWCLSCHFLRNQVRNAEAEAKLRGYLTEAYFALYGLKDEAWAAEKLRQFAAAVGDDDITTEPVTHDLRRLLKGTVEFEDGKFEIHPVLRIHLLDLPRPDLERPAR